MIPVTIFCKNSTGVISFEKRDRFHRIPISHRRCGDSGDFPPICPGSGPSGRTTRYLGRTQGPDPGDRIRIVFNRPWTRSERDLPRTGFACHSQPVRGLTRQPTGRHGGDYALTPVGKKTTGPADPIRLTSAELRALPELHRLVAQIYLNRGSGEVLLVE
jgi:hypothetical protein